MRATKQVIDVSGLPVEAQRELLDFFDFLKAKSRRARKIRSGILPAAFYEPLPVNRYVKVAREDIYAEI